MITMEGDKTIGYINVKPIVPPTPHQTKHFPPLTTIQKRPINKRMPGAKRTITPTAGGGGKRARKAGARKKGYALTRQLVGRQNHLIVQGVFGNVQIHTTNGFTIGTNSSPAIQFFFCGTRAFFALGASAPTQFGNLYVSGGPLVSVFDKFRIRKVETEIVYSANSLGATVANAAMQNMYGVIDYDDSGPLTAVEDALAYPTCKLMVLGQAASNGGSIHRMNLTRPTVIESVQNSALGSTNAKHCVSPWLDTGASDIPHYGLKYYLNSPIPSGALVGMCTFTFHVFLEYKDTR